MQPVEPANQEDYSPVVGGPLYGTLIRLKLSRPSLDLIGRRILVALVLCWLPLAILSAIEGRAFGDVHIPFLLDITIQVRLLVALPLLLLAEWATHRTMVPTIRRFRDAGIVPPEEQERFHRIVESSLRLQRSRLVELAMAGLVIAVCQLFWRQHSPMTTPSWLSATGSPSSDLSMAGYWYLWMSLPVFQFLLIRWCYRLIIWFHFLWRLARLNLTLLPAHPDRAGGLGFLSRSALAIMPLLSAMGALLSAFIARSIFFDGAALMDFKVEVVGVILFGVALGLAPLLVFLPRMVAAKRQGLREFGLLATTYVGGFERKWIHGEGQNGEPLLGSADIQSLADLGNSYSVVEQMRVVPFTRLTVIQLTLAIVVPLFPLILTIISPKELLQQLVSILF